MGNLFFLTRFVFTFIACRQFYAGTSLMAVPATFLSSNFLRDACVLQKEMLKIFPKAKPVQYLSFYVSDFIFQSVDKTQQSGLFQITSSASVAMELDLPLGLPQTNNLVPGQFGARNVDAFSAFIAFNSITRVGDKVPAHTAIRHDEIFNTTSLRIYDKWRVTVINNRN